MFGSERLEGENLDLLPEPQKENFERERRFVVAEPDDSFKIEKLIGKLNLNFEEIKKTKVEIVQFYYQKLDDVRRRARQYTKSDGSVDYVSAVKSKKEDAIASLSKEAEIYITGKTFNEFRNKASEQGEKVIFKDRYYIPTHHNQTVHLDVYPNGLVVAEVEFKTSSQAKDFEIPEWFGNEITKEKGYVNRIIDNYPLFFYLPTE